ncbi:hypothetical protein HQO42_05375 [Rhodococcus fascians]|nr:hypothetical protein [Rhodococcus fascians]MBY4236564.1 hypothetical protein [Rhodococcus fascians]MBY4252070.1 hypothetical protein [Rhodococcus fascians]MBY4267909.1 hypothetical protein [Rhodococcus fascians]
MSKKVYGAIVVLAFVVLTISIIFGKRRVFGQLLDWPLRAEVWGTAGQWVASILTFASLAVALYLILRDRVHKEQENAVKAFCWIEHDEFVLRPHFINTSDQPVVGPTLIMVPKPLEKITALQKAATEQININRAPYLTKRLKFKHRRGNLETSTFRKDEQSGSHYFTSEMPFDHYDAFVRFTDASGVDWAKSVPGGKILSSRRATELENRSVSLEMIFKKSIEFMKEIEELKRDKSKDIAKEANSD